MSSDDTAISYLKKINRYLEESVRCFENLKKKHGQLEKIADILKKAKNHGNRIFLLGNGGSAATASHLAVDLTRIGSLKVIALTDNVPLITAWSNDEEYSVVFKEQLRNLAEKEDVIIGISVSGKSKNIIEAVKFANKEGCITVGLTGPNGGELKNMADICLTLDTDMQHSEDIHLAIGHIIALLLTTASMDHRD